MAAELEDAAKPCCTGSREQGCRESQRQISTAGGRTESRQQGKEVSESHCRRAAARKAFLFVRDSGGVLGGCGAAQEGGPFYIKV